jgi:hypothetical protein
MERHLKSRIDLVHYIIATARDGGRNDLKGKGITHKLSTLT